MQITGVTTEEQRAIETLYRAFGEGNPDLLDEAVTPDWQDIPLAPHQAPGRDGIKPLIAEFRAAFPDLTITILEIIGAGGRIAVRAEMAGTHRGTWFGRNATGRPFRIALHEFHYVAGGRITHTWHLEDWLGWQAQVAGDAA